MQPTRQTSNTHLTEYFAGSSDEVTYPPYVVITPLVNKKINRGITQSFKGQSNVDAVLNHTQARAGKIEMVNFCLSINNVSSSFGAVRVGFMDNVALVLCTIAGDPPVVEYPGSCIFQQGGEELSDPTPGVLTLTKVDVPITQTNRTNTDTYAVTPRAGSLYRVSFDPSSAGRVYGMSFFKWFSFIGAGIRNASLLEKYSGELQ